MPKQCLFFYGGFEADGGGSFTLQGSTSPSRGTFRFRLQYGPRLPQFGDLVLTDSMGATIYLKGCRVIQQHLTGGGGERWLEVTIEDRRWRWQYARIWGSFNTIEGNQILDRTKASAQELAKYIMNVIGETAFDASALPANSYPTFDWSGDSAVGALEELLSQYGCILVPLYSGMWVVFPDGYGPKPALDMRAMDLTPSQEPKVVPDQVVFEGGPTLWQHDLPLEPVGVESMSEKAALKPIDNLSYKPANGWKFQDPEFFGGVAAAKRELAKRCIWKYYRILGPFQLTTPPNQLPNGHSKGGLGKQITQRQNAYYKVDADKTWRILPLESKQLSIKKAKDETDAPEAAIVGYFREDKHTWTNNAEAPASADDKDKLIDTSSNQALQYEGGFSIDPERGLVVFSEPMFYYERTGPRSTARLPAKIRLRTSFGLRDPDTRALLCQQYWYAPPQSSRQGIAQLVKRPEFIFEIADRENTNVNDYVAQAKLCLSEALTGFASTDGASVPYKGFVFDQGLSGAIRAITWAVNGGVGTTQVDYLNDRGDLRLSARDLRSQALAMSHTMSVVQAKRAANVAAKKSNRRPVQ